MKTGLRLSQLKQFARACSHIQYFGIVSAVVPVFAIQVLGNENTRAHPAHSERIEPYSF
jgi:hypothetical protein